MVLLLHSVEILPAKLTVLLTRGVTSRSLRVDLVRLLLNQHFVELGNTTGGSVASVLRGLVTLRLAGVLIVVSLLLGYRLLGVTSETISEFLRVS